MSIKKKIKNLIPEPILKPLQSIYYNLSNAKRLREEAKMIAEQPELHRKAIEKIRSNGGPINVVFFALFDSVWKYDILYQLMERDERFNPIILVCPVVNYGKENMLKNMDRCYNLFKSRGYNVIKSYNPNNDAYVDVRKGLNPDIIFYTNPYEGLIDDRYYITNYRDVLTVFVNYNFPNAKSEYFNYGEVLHNLVWKRFTETKKETENANNYKWNLNHNAIHSGYPGIDCFIKKDAKFKDIWKIKDKKYKRIIWAPHHTISNYAAVCYSTFLTYYNFMFEMAEKYNERVQIAFKPHPLLKNRLNILWGENNTREYYAKWENLPNGMLNDSAYEDLFMTSDAMIHDSGSFIAEYLFTNNPAMYLSNGRPFQTQYNDTALSCLDNYYIGRSKEDIENFLINIIEGKDPKKESRLEFIKNELIPPNGKLASENIIDDIVSELIPDKN